MTEAAYECLRDALTLARGDNPPRTVRMLRRRLEAAGHSAEAIAVALTAWSGSITKPTIDD